MISVVLLKTILGDAEHLMSILVRIFSIFLLLEESCSEGQCSELPEGSDTEQSCWWRNHQRDLNCDCSGLRSETQQNSNCAGLGWAVLSIQTNPVLSPHQHQDSLTSWGRKDFPPVLYQICLTVGIF